MADKKLSREDRIAARRQQRLDARKQTHSQPDPSPLGGPDNPFDLAFPISGYHVSRDRLHLKGGIVDKYDIDSRGTAWQNPDLSWDGGQGILANDPNPDPLHLSNTRIRCDSTGIWYDGPELRLLNVALLAGVGGGNDYGIRGSIRKFHAENCIFTHTGNKAALRVYNCADYFSTNCVYEGAQVIFGGGGQSEWENQGEFAGKVVGGRIKVAMGVQTYSKTVIEFDGVDFCNSGWIYLQAGAHVTLTNCKNVPEIKRDSKGPTTLIVNGKAI